MLKEFFPRYAQLVFDTSNVWTRIAETRNNDHPIRDFVLPATALACATHLIGGYIGGGWNQGVRAALAAGLTLTVTLFLSVACVLLASRFFLKRNVDTDTARFFAAYCCAPVFWVTMLEPMAGNFFYIGALKFYAVYVAWAGAYPLWRPEGAPRVRFSLAVGLAIALLPSIARWLIGAVFPGLVS